MREKTATGRRYAMRLCTKGRYAVMAMADLAAPGASRPRRGAGRDRRAPGDLALLPGTAVRAPAPQAAWCSQRPRPRRRLSPGPRGRRDRDRRHRPSPSTSRCAPPAAPAQGKGCMLKGERCLTHDLWEELGRQIEDYLACVSPGRRARAAGCARDRRGRMSAASISTTTPPRRSGRRRRAAMARALERRRQSVVGPRRRPRRARAWSSRRGTRSPP